MTNDPNNPFSAASDAPPSGGYEFDETQNKVIGELAGAMRFVGIASIVLAVLMWLIGIAEMFQGDPAGLGQIIQGVLLVFIGVWTRSSAASFQLVVDTKGNDIANLMNALDVLRRLYGLQKWLMILMAVLFVGAFALGVAFVLVLAPHHTP